MESKKRKIVTAYSDKNSRNDFIKYAFKNLFLSVKFSHLFIIQLPELCEIKL